MIQSEQFTGMPNGQCPLFDYKYNNYIKILIGLCLNLSNQHLTYLY